VTSRAGPRKFTGVPTAAAGVPCCKDALPAPQPMTRGTDSNPPNRFAAFHLEPDPDHVPDPESPDPLPRTRFLRDDSRSILNENHAEDLSFELSLNPYRGCEHGCAYCYARPYHEYLGFSAGLDFESRIVVKEDAPALLEAELMKRGYRPRPLSLSGVTDCYQPVERRLRITRGCLEVLARFRHPVTVITKNFLVTRDLDFLGELARHRAAAVYLSVTTLDAGLARELEPRASSPRARLEALRRLNLAGIPAGIAVAPVIPGLNEHEVPALLEAAAAAGARFATYSMVRLPGAVAGIFTDWLERHHPLKAAKVLERIRATHGGRLNNSTPGERMRGSGPHAGQTRALFHAALRRCGLSQRAPDLSLEAFRRPGPVQGELF
jgi:DNA repair photolyase